eukprot:6206794-Pleurochrysis_carterae.AAC.2
MQDQLSMPFEGILNAARCAKPIVTTCNMGQPTGRCPEIVPERAATSKWRAACAQRAPSTNAAQRRLEKADTVVRLVKDQRSRTCIDMLSASTDLRTT